MGRIDGYPKPEKWIKRRPAAVAVQLIRELAFRTYNTLAKSLKEVVSNAFDAGARNVGIIVSDDLRTITIDDDGCGMSEDDFESKFLRVSGSDLPDSNPHVSSRPVIGRLGVGVPTTLKLAEEISVMSKKERESALIYNHIDTKPVFAPENLLKDLDEVLRFDHFSEKAETPSEHYTSIQFS